MNRDHLNKILATCGMAAPPLLVAFIVVAAAVTPGYSHISDTVSQLGAQDRLYPWVMSMGFIVYGLLIFCLNYGLYRESRRGLAPKASFVSLSIYGLGVLLSGFFQDSSKAPGVTANLESNLHSIFAMIGFFGLVVGMWLFARMVHLDPNWRGYTQLSISIAVLNLGLSLLFLMEGFRSFEGLLQRSFYLLTLVWISAVSWRLYQLSRSPGPSRRDSKPSE